MENLTNEETPQIYCVHGRGPRSALSVLRPGIAATELATSPLPSNPTAVWTLRRANADEYDAYIVVAFANATLVFSIGEEVKETAESGFNAAVCTLHCQLLGDDSLLQVHPAGLRHIKAGRATNEWRAPGRRTITRAASNASQLAIALTGGDIIYFELDPASGMLVEMAKDDSFNEDVSTLDIAPAPEGRARSRFLAVGMYNSTVRVLNLDPDGPLAQLAVQAVAGVPESVLLLYQPPPGGAPTDGGLFLHIGLSTGVLVRTEVDRTTGQLADARSRFLGTRGPRLVAASVRGQRSLLALSSRPWLGFSDAGRFTLSPLSYDALDAASGFASDACPEGFVAVRRNVLHIFSVDNVGAAFNQQSTRLRYTPRRLLVHPTHRTLIVAECDHAAVPLAERADLVARGAADGDLPAGPEFDPEQAALEEQWGAPRGAPGQWAACLRVLDPLTLATQYVAELEGNEAITSACLVTFAGDAAAAAGGDGGAMLAVGTATALRYMPTECEGGAIRLYRFLGDGRRLELLHATPTEGVVGALTAFQGRLLAGVGPRLRLFDLGRRKLLRKCESPALPHHVVTLHAHGPRVFAGDSQESVHYLRYKKSDNHLYVFADEAAPRYLTAALPLDYDSVAGADKFGNIFVSRLPSEVSAAVEDDPTGGKLAGVTGRLGGAPHKAEAVASFHVGDTVTCLARAALQAGGTEVLLYGTVMGAIGALYPFASREDVDFFSHLEMHLRQEAPPLAGRDHLAFRSAYFPVKDVIDGDLCAQFAALPVAKQTAIAAELDRSRGEVAKKLEDMRARLI